MQRENHVVLLYGLNVFFIHLWNAPSGQSDCYK